LKAIYSKFIGHSSQCDRTVEQAGPPRQSLPGEKPAAVDRPFRCARSGLGYAYVSTGRHVGPDSGRSVEVPREHAMHPVHLEYVKRHPFNDFAELFLVVDRLDPKKRDAAMLDTFCQFVKMRKEVLTVQPGDREPWGGLWDDYANYKRFKEACLGLPPNLNEAFMVISIVSYTLSIRFGWAELDKDMLIKISREFIAKMSELVKQAPTEELRKSQLGWIETTRNRIANIDNEIQEARELYSYICENLARPLLQSWRRRLKVPDPAGE
jgi:hypothetical protein